MNETANGRSRSASALWVGAALLLLVGVAVWGALAFRAPAGGGPGAAGAAGGGALPELALAGLDGRAFDARRLDGRVVLYDFWATWCGPCHLQADVLKAIYPEARARGAEFVGIATGEPADVVREFLAGRPLPYPVALDPESRLEAELAIYGLPTLVVVDRRGRIAYRHTGLIDADTLREVLARAEAG